MRLSLVWLCLLVPCLAFSAGAQGSAVAAAHGRVVDVSGAPLTTGYIGLINERSAGAALHRLDYRFAVDKLGKYRAFGVVPGIYVAALYLDDRMIYPKSNIEFLSNRDLELNFDMSSDDYTSRQSPERVRINAVYREMMAKINLDEGLRTTLQEARADVQAGRFELGAAKMREALQTRPDEALFWYTLGDAETGEKQFDTAISAYQKGLSLAPRVPTWSVLRATVENSLGYAFASSGSADKAAEAYERAAGLDPQRAGAYYLNEAFLMHNLRKEDAALRAADQAIAADRRLAEAYYVRGQVLIGRAVADPVSHRIVPPRGCVEAYRKYLDLEPAGRFAPEVRDILGALEKPV